MFTLSHISHFYLKIYIYDTLSIYLSLRNAINYLVEFISKSIENVYYYERSEISKFLYFKYTFWRILIHVFSFCSHKQ